MAAHLAGWHWSSYAAHATGQDNKLIHPHASYLALGNTQTERCAAYRVLLDEVLSPDDLDSIRLHLQRQHALGSERFRAAIEAQLNPRAGPAKIGRPRKGAHASKSAL
ncbi:MULTISPECIES: hypothetical protein [unclassified Dyella]|uniref:hypothetical protein n=1 Tax=unclassified Dyella TaxID=2634549 RepID=UPI000C85795F|nr:MULTISPECIES: hypothetical protein [unclassified Dyella]MDR3443756.1 transposase [Dyella sp.]